jgi:hypothetical protein
LHEGFGVISGKSSFQTFFLVPFRYLQPDWSLTVYCFSDDLSIFKSNRGVFRVLLIGNLNRPSVVGLLGRNGNDANRILSLARHALGGLRLHRAFVVRLSINSESREIPSCSQKVNMSVGVKTIKPKTAVSCQVIDII